MKWINNHKSNACGEWDNVTIVNHGFQFNTELSSTFNLHDYRYVHIAEDTDANGNKRYYFVFVKEPLNVSKAFIVSRFNKSCVSVRVGASSLAKKLLIKYKTKPLYIKCRPVLNVEFYNIKQDNVALCLSMENEDNV